jgi:hypothetical protein
MLIANDRWETKLEKEIGQPFYGKEKLIWRPTEGFGIRYVRKKGSKIEMPLEDAPLGKFFTDDTKPDDERDTKLARTFTLYPVRSST